MHFHFRPFLSHCWLTNDCRARLYLPRHRAGIISARLMLWLLVVVVMVFVVAGLIAAPLEDQSLMEWLVEPFQTPQGWA